MTSSALSDYLMGECRKVAGLADDTEDTPVKLNLAQLKDLFLNDKNLSASPLQVMSLIRLAEEEEDGLVNCVVFVPLASSTLEHMFDPAFLQRRARLIKRSEMKPIELMSGRDREGLEKEVRDLFAKADTDGNGTLDQEEFKACLESLDLGLSNQDIESLRVFADEVSRSSGPISPDWFIYR